jgi:uncharacterized membrane protein
MTTHSAPFSTVRPSPFRAVDPATRLPGRASIATLAVSTVTTGLLAGVYYGFSIAVMPALDRVDDHTFVEVMNKINIVIVGPAFMVSFLGSVLGSTAAAIVLRRDRRLRRWVWPAAVLSVAGFLMTVAINVPLNNQLASAVDLDAARHHFQSLWVPANNVRAVLTTLSFAALSGALVAVWPKTARRIAPPWR